MSLMFHKKYQLLLSNEVACDISIYVRPSRSEKHAESSKEDSIKQKKYLNFYTQAHYLQKFN